MEPLSLADMLDALAALGCEGAVRDERALLSAMSQPFQAVFGQQLYPPPYLQAAALFYFTERAQALVDGNKRLGWTGARRILAEYGLALSASTRASIEFGLAVAHREPPLDTIEGIAAWYEANTRPFVLES